MNQPVLMPVHLLASAVLGLLVPLALLGPLALLVPLARAALGLLVPLGLLDLLVLLGLLVLLVLLAPAVLVAYKTNQWGHLLRHNLISDLRAQARVVAPRLFAGDCGCLGESTVREAYKICLRLAALRRMIADVFLN
jgi:hypothetical protein